MTAFTWRSILVPPRFKRASNDNSFAPFPPLFACHGPLCSWQHQLKLCAFRVEYHVEIVFAA